MIRHLRNTYARAREYVRRRPGLYGLVRVLKYGPFLGWRDGRLRADLIAEGRDKGWLMLNLGSGGRYERLMINLDVTPVTGPDVVGDGYALPFAAGTFQLVVCDYVIEHVADPERFLRHVGTVLRADGRAYFSVPFLQPWHGAPHDYTRWTRDGFRLLAERAGFDVRAVAVHAGSAYTLFWILKEWIATLIGVGIPPVVGVLRYMFAWIFCPLLILDVIVPPVFRSETLASGYAFVLVPRHRCDLSGVAE